jgi:hypothetical protein
MCRFAIALSAWGSAPEGIRLIFRTPYVYRAVRPENSALSLNPRRAAVDGLEEKSRCSAREEVTGALFRGSALDTDEQVGGAERGI